MSRNWIYDWLISCPAVLVLGEATYKGLKGFATLTLLYPRVSILSKDGYVRVINSLPYYMDSKLIEELCLDISKASMEEPLREVMRRTMFYGGYNVYLIDSSGEVINAVFELVDASKIFIYIREAIGDYVTASLEHWLVFGIGLRTGDFRLIKESCREIGVLMDCSCLIKSRSYELLITSIDKNYDGFKRVLPDNNPARHVVKL